MQYCVAFGRYWPGNPLGPWGPGGPGGPIGPGGPDAKLDSRIAVLKADIWKIKYKINDSCFTAFIVSFKLEFTYQHFLEYLPNF